MDWAAPNLPNVASKDTTSSHTALLLLDGKVKKELARLDPSVPFQPRARYLHHTWAQTFCSRPELFFQPKSIPELQKIVTLARRCRKRLCVTGYGHSPSDITCTSSWLINLDHLDKILEFDVDSSPGRVRFQAGISLHNLNQTLADKGFTLPNLGSIDVQSLAGSISTGTHGSSLKHGLLSQSVTSLTILLSNSQLVTCSATKNPDLFRAALISLGTLGIIVEMTFQSVPDFNIAWSQTLHPLSNILSTWSTSLWTTHEYTRVWWLPYLERAVIWRANRTTSPPKPPNTTFYGGKLGYYLYHNLLFLSNTFPRILPWIERFIFGMQYGFRPGAYSMSAIQPAREGLLMDCLYSQFVNEWALPLSRGPEAITRLSAWINHRPESEHRIPFSSNGIWVHAPIEVRVSNSDTTANNHNGKDLRPFLDPTLCTADEPTLYLNATLYRPYGLDPPCMPRYYEAFEYLMRELGGRPHWAKNFAYTTSSHIREMYGNDMKQFLAVRDEVDATGIFWGGWHGRTLGSTTATMGEQETSRRKMGRGFGDAMLWDGEVVVSGEDENVRDTEKISEYFEEGDGILRVDVVKRGLDDHEHGGGGSRDSPSPPMTSTSDESFDYMAKGEASVYAAEEKKDI